MPITTDSTSRFKETETVIKDGRETFGLWTRPTYLFEENLEDEEIIRIQVTQDIAGRPDLISIQQYETSFLDWVIVMFNRPADTLGWPRAGTIIKVPNRNALDRIL